ncbi:hypothetical protein RclHR1_10020003 [Rhizophagus clarus]|uniref:Protein kinase domain-containing protein n=1 Tax=Rhizophagus clarus TaxID=94130 RepID=A0A2Z6QC97_9GLOM|nr:hypothetical protein RclHR1_10020003 [Rhizophagus clarus]
MTHNNSNVDETEQLDVTTENDEHLIITIPLPRPDKAFLDDIQKIYSNDFQEDCTDNDVTLDYLFASWNWMRTVQSYYDEYFGEDAIQPDYAAMSPDNAYQDVLFELEAIDLFGVREFTKFNPELKPIPRASVLWKFSEQDIPNWETLRSMYRDCPDMKSWIHCGFDMWQMCRMYQLYKERPENADILRSIVGDYPYKRNENSYEKSSKYTQDTLSKEEYTLLSVLIDYPRIKFGHFCEFIPYKELYDILPLDTNHLTQSLQKTSWNDAKFEKLTEWFQDLVSAGITKIARWNPWRGRRSYIWVNNWLTFAHETTKYSPYGDKKAPLTLLLSPKIPNKLFNRRDYWDEFSDCGLTRQVPHAKPLMVQTFPGFCYRFFKEKHGENSAKKLFTMRVDVPDNAQRLQRELGDLYERDFGHFIEWIPYENLSNVTYMTRGGFGRIYTAKWKPQQNVDLSRYQRDLSGNDPIPVALKYIFNAEKITESFLRELNVVVHALSAYPIGFVKFWGLTRRPVSKTIESISEKNSLPPSNAILLVMEFATHGTLRDFLLFKKSSMNWTKKIDIAYFIANGIKIALHSKGIAHRDLHPGNILMLNVSNGPKSSIRGCVTDVGLSGYVQGENAVKAGEQKGVLGVLPYIAPEVLRGEPYTLAADVYSLGIILWQIAANRSPFSDRLYDISLKREICEGLREKLIPHIPKDYQNIYTQCWDEDPEKRPTMNDVVWKLERLWGDSLDGKLTIDDEGADDNGPEEIMNKSFDNYSQVHSNIIHNNAIYHSRLISTESIFECTVKDSEICWQPSFTIDQEPF